MSLVQQSELVQQPGVEQGGGCPAGPTGPAGAELGVRLHAGSGLVSSVLDDLASALLADDDAVELYRSFVLVERLCLAAKTQLGARIASSGVWRQGGHRNAAGLLAQLEGTSTGRARATLELGRQLAQLPGTNEAFRTGRLSGQQVTELASAAVLDPEREAELLAGAADEPFHRTRERAQRSRASSARRDPLAAARRIHARRSFRSWTDAEGAFCYQGTDTADRGAHIMAHINYVAGALRKQRKADGVTEPEPHEALCADAFHALATGEVAVGTGDGGGSTTACGTDDGTGLDVDPGASDPGIVTGLDVGPGASDPGISVPAGGSASIITRPPTCSVMVRVDLEALLRGDVEPGELCEIDSQGPIPVPMARHMLNDSFLRFVFTRAGDIHGIYHFGRTINARLRTALAHRDRTCVVPGCGVSFGLEIDHIRPVTDDGPTTLDNLSLLCHHHHWLKTFEGWVLTRHDRPAGPGGTDQHHPAAPDQQGPLWTFEPPLPFGREPDLGIDSPEARAQWHRDRARTERQVRQARAAAGMDGTPATDAGREPAGREPAGCEPPIEPHLFDPG